MGKINNRAVKEHSLILGTEINEEITVGVIAALVEASKDKKAHVTIYINCPGGGSYDAVAIYEAIKQCPHPVTGFVTGTCWSAATLVLQACEKRIMTPNSSFMMHAGTTATSRMHAYEAAVEARESDRHQTQFYDLLRQRSNMGKEDFEKKIIFAHYMTPQQALEYRFIDEISVPKSGFKHQ